MTSEVLPELCDELWGGIASWLPVRDVLHLSLVSHVLLRVCREDYVWKTLCAQDPVLEECDYPDMGIFEYFRIHGVFKFSRELVSEDAVYEYRRGDKEVIVHFDAHPRGGWFRTVLVGRPIVNRKYCELEVNGFFIENDVSNTVRSDFRFSQRSQEL